MDQNKCSACGGTGKQRFVVAQDIIPAMKVPETPEPIVCPVCGGAGRFADFAWMVEVKIDMSPSEAMTQGWAVARETAEEAEAALRAVDTGIYAEDAVTARHRLSSAEIVGLRLKPDELRQYLP